MSNDLPPPPKRIGPGDTFEPQQIHPEPGDMRSDHGPSTKVPADPVPSKEDPAVRRVPQPMDISQVAELLDALDKSNRGWFDWLKDLAIPFLALAVGGAGVGVGVYAAKSQVASQVSAAQSAQRETAYAAFMEAEDKINVAFLRIKPYITQPQYFDSSNVIALLDAMTAARADTNTASQAVLLVGSDDMLPKRTDVIDHEQKLCNVVYHWRDEVQTELPSRQFSQFLDTYSRFSEALEQHNKSYNDFVTQARADVKIT